MITYPDGRFESFGQFQGYVSQSNYTYSIDVPLPFTIQTITGALVNPSYRAFYLTKWYINEPQTYSKDNLDLVFITGSNIPSQIDLGFDIYCEGTVS